MLRRSIVGVGAVALLLGATASAYAGRDARAGGAAASKEEPPRAALRKAGEGAGELDSRLEQVRSAAARGPAAATTTARSLGVQVVGGRIRVMLETTETASTATLKAAVLSAGGAFEASGDRVVRALVPAAALRGLAARQDVSRVRPPFRPHAAGVAGEGSAEIGSAPWAALGRGEAVAIVDVGFSGYDDAQASGDLPATLTTVDYCGGDLGGDDPHGTAVAEIVHEVSPNSALHLICIDDEISLERAVDYVIAQGIKVINHSVVWFNTAPGDGTGEPWTPDARAAEATANEIVWVNAAGNNAQEHWAGAYDDWDRDGFHDWAPFENLNSFVAPAGVSVCVLLKWNDWTNIDHDYDLYVVRLRDGAVFASENDQIGGYPYPTEEFCLPAPVAEEEYAVAIAVFADGHAQPRLDLFVLDALALEYVNPFGSIAEPASSPNVLAVGAYCWQTDALQPYSARGPAQWGRSKPNLVGPDSVSSFTYGPFSSCGASGFSGTSAAAPHAAAAAALVRSELGATTSDERVRQYLGEVAHRVSAFETNEWGGGRLTLRYQAPTVETGQTRGGPTRNRKTTFTGWVTTNGMPTKYWVEWGPASNPTAHRTEERELWRVARESVSFPVTGLTPSTEYRYRLMARSLFGTVAGETWSWTSDPPMAPGISTIGSIPWKRWASVAGRVTPRDLESTYGVEWGLTTAYGSVHWETQVLTGEEPVHVFTEFHGLEPGTTYHYRLIAKNADGTSHGEDRTITTHLPRPPLASTEYAFATSSTSASLNGKVDGEGAPYEWWFEYGTTTAYGSQTPAVSYPGDPGYSGVERGVTLSPGTTYHYRVAARNEYGTTYGADKTFAMPSGSGGGGGGGGGGGAADIVLTGSAAPTTPSVGDSVTWRLQVEDRTLALIYGVYVDVQLPAGLELGHSQADRGPGCGPVVSGKLRCNLDFLAGVAPFGNVLLVTRVTQPGEHVLTAVSGFDGVDPTPGDNGVTLRVSTPVAATPPNTPTAPRGVVRNGRAGADRLAGTPFADTLRGLGGNDVLRGLGGNDRLEGGSGDDRLVGGPGSDVLLGGAGNDTIEARDGRRDVVRCGAGRDTVVADRIDSVARDCERVRRR
jgi:Ca2+-binding RTX toxin-like protein